LEESLSYMRSTENDLKTIKVSPEVHEELAVRKHGGESFDEVLKRTLGLVPRTVKELTATLPERLATATTNTVTEHVTTDERYRRIGRREEDKLTLEFVSTDANKRIFDISV
jgi:predicted CopG family antitoxin